MSSVAVSKSERRSFTTVTEMPSKGATSDQLQILVTRYHLAARWSQNRDILEAACGPGVGLGLMASVGRCVVAGDIDPENCRLAQKTYRDRPDICIQMFDAECMPFTDRSFDTIILYEALYYIPNVGRFLREVRRVLRPGGVLLVSSVNCEWSGFNASPLSTKYYKPREFGAILESQGFAVQLLVGFPEEADSAGKKIIGMIRRAAVSLHLIPKTMKGKEWLKRLFYGKMKPIPSELTEGLAVPAKLEPIESHPCTSGYRFYYAVAKLNGGGE